MEQTTQAPRHPGFPGWTQTPIPGISLSAGGLLALADLTTVAQRTAIKGGSSWLDSLLLVPGLHYQQAADELARAGGGGWGWGWDYDGVGGEGFVGTVNNSAMMMYLNRVAHQARERGGEVVLLDVGTLGKKKRKKEAEVDGGDGDDDHCLDLGWVSHWLYLMSPILTVVALVMLVLVEDWWALGCILTLMISRVLNIWVIKQRAQKKVHFDQLETDAPPPPSHSRPPSTATVESSATDTSQLRRQRRRHERQQRATKAPPPPPPQPSPSPLSTSPTPPSNKTQITIMLPSSAGRVQLRGSPADLHAVTAETWLRAKTRREGYLEAAAKLLVYLVAAVSGNWTQAGAIVVMVLLLASAGLLALSNGSARGVEVNGRIVAAGTGGGKAVAAAGGEGVLGDGYSAGDGVSGEMYNGSDGGWVNGTGGSRGGDSGDGMDDCAERGMAHGVRKREEDGEGSSPYIYPPARE